MSVVPVEYRLEGVVDDVGDGPGTERDGDGHFDGGEGDESNESGRVETSSGLLQDGLELEATGGEVPD